MYSNIKYALVNYLYIVIIFFYKYTKSTQNIISMKVIATVFVFCALSLSIEAQTTGLG